jgi:malate/lactate dehydrogenase
MQPIQADATLIVAVEPVDIFVDQLRRITSLRPERIMGTGHITICHHRFRRWFHEYQAGLKLVSTTMTEPWVIGTAQAPIVIWPELTKKDGKKKSGGAHDQSVHQLKENWVGNIMFESTLIVEKKGDAWFGASGSVMQLISALLNPDDAHALHTVVCTWHPQLEVCASFPVILNNQGIVSTIDIPLEDADKDSLISMALEQTLTV